MFDRLIEWVVQFAHFFKFWVVINEFEDGIVLRWGKFNRCIGPGFHLIIPFEIEATFYVETTIHPLDIPAQSLTSADGKSINVSATVRYQIIDAKAFILQVMHDEHIVGNSVKGSITQVVTDHPFRDLLELSDVVARMAKRDLKDYGIKIHSLKFVDAVVCKSLRLIH